MAGQLVKAVLVMSRVPLKVYASLRGRSSVSLLMPLPTVVPMKSTALVARNWLPANGSSVGNSWKGQFNVCYAGV